MESVMVEAAKTGGLVLVLFSAKPEPPSVLKQLAVVLQGAVSVAFFPEPDPQSMDKFQVWGARRRVGSPMAEMHCGHLFRAHLAFKS